VTARTTTGTRAEAAGRPPRRGATVLLLLVATSTAACGVGGSGPAQPLTEIPPGIVDTVPPTTTTTTTSTTTTLPGTTLPEATTTTTTIPTEEVVLYFLVGDRPVPVVRLLPRPVDLSRVLAALAQGPLDDDLGFTTELRTALPADLVRGVDEQAGVAVVDLSAQLQDVPGRDQRLVFAQLVLTLRQQRSVGQVRFTEDGTPTVALTGDGEATRPDEVLTEQDYESLLAGTGQPPVAGTVDPTAAPTTTPPPG
jgi:hypothetical protein